jgi:hypothetical protein
MRVYLADENGLPTRPYHLIVTRNALNAEEVKYFISNAPEPMPVKTLLAVAFSRWTIERAFQDSKMELGMDHFEVRKYLSIQRHLILTCLSHTFLSEFRDKHREKNPRLTVNQVATATACTGGGVEPRRLPVPCSTRQTGPLLPEAGRIDQCAIGVNATAKRKGRSQPPSPHNTPITPNRHPSQKHRQMSWVTLVAL